MKTCIESDVGRIRLEKADGIATITLDRPAKLNAMTAAMRAQFGVHVRDVTADANVRVVLLRGEGKAFCAGADLADPPRTPMAWRERVMSAQAQHLQLIRSGKLVIAEVQGMAAGGAAALALSADILLMADDACLGFPFVKIGLVPDAGTGFLLQAKLGPALAMDLLATAGTLDAAEAAALGLTRRVLPTGGLQAAARQLARQLAALPAEALMLTKGLCTQRWTHTLEASLAHEADAFALAAATDSHRAALAGVARGLRRDRKREQKGTTTP